MADAKTALLAADARSEPPICSDYDEDCPGMCCAFHCWMYDPAKGRCPFLMEPCDG